MNPQSKINQFNPFLLVPDKTHAYKQLMKLQGTDLKTQKNIEDEKRDVFPGARRWEKVVGPTKTDGARIIFPGVRHPHV